MQFAGNPKRRFTTFVGLIGTGLLCCAAGQSASAATAYNSGSSSTSIVDTSTDVIGDTASLTSLGTLSSLSYVVGWYGDAHSATFSPTDNTSILTGVTVTLNLYADSGSGNHQGSLLGTYVQTLAASDLDNGFYPSFQASQGLGDFGYHAETVPLAALNANPLVFTTPNILITQTYSNATVTNGSINFAETLGAAPTVGTDLTPTSYYDNGAFVTNPSGATKSGRYTVGVSVPEPASLGLLAIGGVGLLARRRKA